MSYLFDGTTDFFTASSLPVSGPPFSWHVWVRMTSVSGNNDGVLGLHNDSVNDYYSLDVKGGTVNDPLHFKVLDTGIAVGTATIDNVTTGSFQSMGCSEASGNNSRFVYLDGTQSTEETTLVTPDTMESFTIGDSKGASELAGYIAEVAVWDTVLTAANFTDLSNNANPQAIAAGNLVYYVTLKDNTTATVGSITLSATGSPTQDALHPTIDPLGIISVPLGPVW